NLNSTQRPQLSSTARVNGRSSKPSTAAPQVRRRLARASRFLSLVLTPLGTNVPPSLFCHLAPHTRRSRGLPSLPPRRALAVSTRQRPAGIDTAVPRTLVVSRRKTDVDGAGANSFANRRRRKRRVAAQHQSRRARHQSGRRGRTGESHI